MLLGNPAIPETVYVSELLAYQVRMSTAEFSAPNVSITSFVSPSVYLNIRRKILSCIGAVKPLFCKEIEYDTSPPGKNSPDEI